MRRALVVAALAVIAVVVPAIAEETKPLAEVDALRLEKAEAEVSFLLERAARIRGEAQGYARELARRDGTEGWQLDLPRRMWVKPEAKTPSDQ